MLSPEGPKINICGRLSKLVSFPAPQIPLSLPAERTQKNAECAMQLLLLLLWRRLVRSVFYCSHTCALPLSLGDAAFCFLRQSIKGARYILRCIAAHRACDVMAAIKMMAAPDNRISLCQTTTDCCACRLSSSHCVPYDYYYSVSEYANSNVFAGCLCTTEWTFFLHEVAVCRHYSLSEVHCTVTIFNFLNMSTASELLGGILKFYIEVKYFNNLS